MLKKLFNSHLKFVLTPFLMYKAECFNSYGVETIPRAVPIIVSLTSSEEYFNDLIITLYSLLNQNLKPDRIILWLSDEYKSLNDLPYEITKFIKNGLEIRFVKYINSYTKVIYALEEFSNSIIVSVDDDIYYPKDWLRKLYFSYVAHPTEIQVHCAHKVGIEKEKLSPYASWNKYINTENAGFDNFIVSSGGVLYPPMCFSKEALRKDIFLKNIPHAVDIWFWTMALLHNKKIRVVQNHMKTLACTNVFKRIKNSEKQEDEQLEKIMKFYGVNILSKLIQK